MIPGAKIAIVNPSMGFNFAGITNGEGYYFVPYLRPGTYNMTVEGPHAVHHELVWRFPV